MGKTRGSCRIQTCKISFDPAHSCGTGKCRRPRLGPLCKRRVVRPVGRIRLPDRVGSGRLGLHGACALLSSENHLLSEPRNRRPKSQPPIVPLRCVPSSVIRPELPQMFDGKRFAGDLQAQRPPAAVVKMHAARGRTNPLARYPRGCCARMSIGSSLPASVHCRAVYLYRGSPFHQATPSARHRPGPGLQ